MSDDASARLGLPYLAAGQMQKHVTLNEALSRLDALVQLAVVSRTRPDQPALPPDGALYIVPEGATGSAWGLATAGDLIRAEAGGWTVPAVPDGAVAVVLDESAVLARVDGDWQSLGSRLGSVQGLDRLGLNATADAGNPFVARVNKGLWTALETGAGGDGDLRLTLNKEGADDVLSLLFQSGWSGRAELGLIGDDALRLKVSPDGGSWSEALVVDPASGRVTFPRGVGRVEVTEFTISGSYDIPAWASGVEAICVAGGGGGGAGGTGPGATIRFGGGGGRRGWKPPRPMVGRGSGRESGCRGRCRRERRICRGRWWWRPEPGAGGRPGPADRDPGRWRCPGGRGFGPGRHRGHGTRSSQCRWQLKRVRAGR
jgi:hypothetical protein